MAYRIVNMAEDPRSGQFAYFRAMADPWSGITVEVDITEFHAALDGRPFFLSFLYALARAANAVPELRRRLVDSGLLPYEDFLADGKRRQAEALRGEGLAESGDPLSNFFVSCVPWLAYTQLKHPVIGPEDTNPRFSWGKFTEMNGRVTMPVTIFVNHALADGLHIARFYENLNQELAEIVKQIKNSK